MDQKHLSTVIYKILIGHWKNTNNSDMTQTLIRFYRMTCIISDSIHMYLFISYRHGKDSSFLIGNDKQFTYLICELL